MVVQFDPGVCKVGGKVQEVKMQEINDCVKRKGSFILRGSVGETGKALRQYKQASFCEVIYKLPYQCVSYYYSGVGNSLVER